MKITERELKRIIKEEISKFQNKKERVVEVTPEYLNDIIKEEYYNVKREKRLLENRRRRLTRK